MPVTTVHGIVNRIGRLAVALNMSQHRPANVLNGPDNSTPPLRLCPPDGNEPLFVTEPHKLLDEIGRHAHGTAFPVRPAAPRSHSEIVCSGSGRRRNRSFAPPAVAIRSA